MGKLSGLPPTTTLSLSDLLVMIQAAGPTDVKITLANFITALFANGIWWQELARTTLGSSNSTLSATFVAKKYISFKVIMIPTGGTVTPVLTFNNDAGANYAIRFTNNNAVGSSGVSASNIGNFAGAISNTIHAFGDLENIGTQVKIGAAKSMDGSSAAGTAPNYVEFYFKWTNTTDQVTTISFAANGAGQFAAGSELVILGHD